MLTAQNLDPPMNAMTGVGIGGDPEDIDDDVLTIIIGREVILPVAALLGIRIEVKNVIGEVSPIDNRLRRRISRR